MKLSIQNKETIGSDEVVVAVLDVEVVEAEAVAEVVD
jgi:hypothetical protein